MLMRLMVKDFALIHRIELEFDSRFNVLTGETGAGKSIIIDAVSLLLGARANSKDIRFGCSKAMVEGTFLLDNGQSEVKGLLQTLGYELEADEQLILYRELTASGKNICRINDRTVTLASFRQVGKLLINIYGQHDFQAISDKEHHLELLDSLGDKVFVQEKAKMAKAYQDLARAEQQRDSLQRALRERNERLDFLRFKLQELEELQLQEGEEVQLERELSVLDNYEKIATVTEKSYQALYGDRRSVYALLTAAVDSLNTVRQYDNSLDEMAKNLQDMLYLAEDYGLTLSGYSGKIDYDAQRRDRLNERKYTLDKAKRKYNLSIEELIAERERLQQEVLQLEHGDTELEDLQQLCLEKRQEFEQVALQVRDKRQQLAQQLTEGLLTQLSQLAMGTTRFSVQFTEKAASAQGLDQIEFFMSANPGQPLRALSEIASGGEMSRIMLAFKTVLAQHEQIGTLIFDEIDTGIGGNIVVKVAEKLAAVSAHGQVICVTHSPQIAALADRHFQIQKQIADEQTLTNVLVLEEEEAIAELARMLGGEEAFQLQHARALRKTAGQHKALSE
ncbi:MAG: DNA repair protein RecN [Peptococcaceae bacterium]